LCKHRLVRIHEEIVVAENGEDLMDYFEVGVHVSGGDENVVKIDKNGGQVSK
jgi:hypothetical protein